MILSKRVIIILMVLLLGDQCDAGKKEKTKSNDTSKKKKNESKEGGKKHSTSKVGSQYKLPEGGYWASGGYERVWTEQDCPLKNQRFREAHGKLVSSLSINDKPLSQLTDLDVYMNLTTFDRWNLALDAVEQLAVPSVFVSHRTDMNIGITWAGHIDTKGTIESIMFY